MNQFRKGWITRSLAYFFVVLLLVEPFTLSPAWALTGGPSQPEFSSFEPVATTSMVNEFTGDFTYNLPVLEVPGPEGSGYALSLSYHSGTSPEEEASWVGYGWTLNPGAIIRNKKGFPDDSNGDEVDYHSKMPLNWTVSVGKDKNVEIFGKDASIGFSKSIQYNINRGFSKSKSFRLGKGMVSLGYSWNTSGESSYSVNINPSKTILKKVTVDENENIVKEKIKDKDNLPKLASNQYIEEKTYKIGFSGSNYGFITSNWSVKATSFPAYTGEAFNISGSMEGTPSGAPVGFQVGFRGGYSHQRTNDLTSNKSYGYLYTGNSKTSPNSLRDYYTEKLSPFQKRDQYLGIPFSNPDNFFVLGEGLTGSFRAHSKKAGNYYPKSTFSNTTILNVGVEFQSGVNNGIGGDTGAGNHSLLVAGWTPSGSHEFQTSNDNSSDEDYFFRFNNDLGGNILFSEDNDSAESATLLDKKPVVNNINEIAEFSTYNTTQKNNRSGRSSYIGYNTNEAIVKNLQASYSKDTHKDTTERKVASQGIGEFSITQEDGSIYNFGLPVYSKNEKNLQYGFKKVSSGNIKHNYLVYADITDEGNIHTKVGEESKSPYATSHLLTSIYTPDYIDRKLDGPTPDDFGGYTKFNYEKVYGGMDKDWYHWRMPYTGMYFNRNELSSPYDDMCSFVSGDKEVYYLKSIETKTHIAKFILKDRLDGMDAADDNEAAKKPSAKGTHKLKCLDKIILKSKKDPTSLQTVHFEYSYELMKMSPNSDGQGQGRLTLKSIYTDYGGTVPAKIAPYQFNYSYPNSNDYPLPIPYKNDPSFSKNFSLENPNYNPFNLDAWGNYQANGQPRFDNMRTWIDQKNNPSFDPAAWQLKRIVLPSGGEIQVQYEQKDYQYVQNRRAMAMVRLKEEQGDKEEQDDKYYLDISEDLRPSNSLELYELRSIIQKELVDKKERIYFKFLYELLGDDLPNLKKCHSEYIDGYAKVSEVGVDMGGLYVELKNSPRNLCKEYYKTQRRGNIENGQDCSPSIGIDGSKNMVDMARELIAFIGFKDKFSICKKINPELSYLRIPLLEPKKGGGIRVKRLLMYDKGLNGQPVLYGNEYDYKIKDPITGKITSSGVAINEPPTIREESALITNLQKRTDQKWLDKIIAGKDKEEFEGLYGETILPSASVGHRQVTVKNIHSGRSNPGYTVNEFYTAYDYPFDKSYVTGKGFDKTSLEELDKEWIKFKAILVGYAKHNLWLSQGYSFILNDFHGKPKSLKTYTGDYEKIYVSNANAITSSTTYKYYEPGQKIPIAKGLNQVSYESIGKETEVVMEGRKTEDISVDAKLEGDASIGIFGVIAIPFATGVPEADYSESKLHTHVTTKITSYPTILKSVTSTQDGISTTTTNLAFSKENGRPIFTRTSDAFHGLDLDNSSNHNGNYYTYNYPSADIYPALGQKSFNQGYTTSGNFIGMNQNYFTMEVESVSFNEGDFISVGNTENNQTAFFYVLSISGNKIKIKPHSVSGGLDTEGDLIVKVINSHKSNRLNENTGFIQTYGKELNPYSINASVVSGYVEFLNELLQLEIEEGFGSKSLPIPEGIESISMVNGECNYGDYCRSKAKVKPKESKKQLRPSENCMYCLQRATKIIDNSCGDGKHTILGMSCGNKITQLRLPRSVNPSNDYFKINPTTNLIEYFLNGVVKVSEKYMCGQICPSTIQKLAGVIDVGITTYADDWALPTNIDSVYGIKKDDYNSPYETGAKGKWRPNANYVYKESIIHGTDDPNTSSDDNNRIYKNAGVYNDFVLFDWKDLSKNDPEKWIKVNQVNTYSPHGQVLEEENLRGIKSIAKYGYDHNLPYLIAQNADYNSVYFESFENLYGNQLEAAYNLPPTSNISKEKAHSGKQSLKVSEDHFDIPGFTISPKMRNAGMSVKMWVSSKDKGNLKLHFFNPTTYHPFRTIARIGTWSLVEAKISADEMQNIIDDNPPMHIDTPSSADIWIDDLRIQPLDAQMTCYVYDASNYRLLTQFDDQHFGLYYQYNAQGQLVRKIVETEKGIKTVTETQYHTPKMMRTDIEK